MALLSIIKNFRRPKQRDLIAFSVIIIILVLYFSTSLRYDTLSPYYTSNIFYVVSRCIVPFLMGWFGGYQPINLSAKLKKNSQYIVLLLTAGALIAAYFSSGQTIVGGYIDDDSGFRYQNISYALAYANAIMLYLILNQKKLIKNKAVFYAMWICFPLQWVGVLVSGGKGGFVTICVLSFINLLIYWRRHPSNVVIKRIVLTIPIVLIVGYYIVRYVSKVQLGENAFFRIIRLLTLSDDTGRSLIRVNAFDVIKSSPIWGCGIGSVSTVLYPYPYSHNLFLDALIELGIFGFFAYFVLFIISFYEGLQKTNSDVTEIIMIILLCGFIRANLSGYY